MDILFDEFREDACKYSEPGIDTSLVCTMDPAGGEIPCIGDNCPFMIRSNRRHRQEHKVKYLMKYECWNCDTEFCSFIKKGEPAIGHGGKCPYCGMEDNTSKDHSVMGIAKAAEYKEK